MDNKSLKTYQAAILAVARGLWRGEFDTLAGADALFSAISRGFEQAWQEGAATCGILPDERTEEEDRELKRLIGDNFQHVGRFVEWVLQNNKASGTKWAVVQGRAKLWINRYEQVKNTAIALSCKDTKFRWQIDGGEHCRTCLKLNGRVARASIWASHNIAPQMITDRLQCQGYNCKCMFIETDAPATRGRFPNLP